MEDSKGDILKKLIQKAVVEKPSPGFTEFVMHSVQLESQREVLITNELNTLLQQNAIEKPSADFIVNVMSKVEVPRRKLVAEPIISRRTWYLVAAASITLMAFLGFYYQAVGEISNVPSKVSVLDKMFDVLFINMAAMPSITTTSLIAAGCLLLMDYFLRNRFLKRAF